MVDDLDEIILGQLQAPPASAPDHRTGGVAVPSLHFEPPRN